MRVVLGTNHISELVRDSKHGWTLRRQLAARDGEALTTIVNAQEITEGWCALINRLPTGERQVNA